MRGARRRQARAHGAGQRRPALHARRAPRKAATTCSSCASRQASRPTPSRSGRVAAVYSAAPDRYDRMQYRRSGRSGLQLPAISLGLWHNFGDDRPLETSRAILRRAFDLGIIHFDLANNYGPPYGSAEANFGRLFREDFRPVPRRARDLDEGRLRHVARPVRRVGLAQVPAREPRPVARSGWGSSTSTSSTRTASTPRRRSRRRWARSTRPCGRARRSTPASPPTRPRRRARRRRSCAGSARRS